MVSYSIWNVEQELSSAGINFTVAQSAIKLEIQLNRWNFSQPSNTLDLHLHLTTQPNVTSILPNSQLNASITSYTLFSANALLTTINFINNCVVDNTSFVPVSFSINNTGPYVHLVVHLPHFSDSLLYDPDFSEILGSSGGDGGSSNNLQLLALLSLLVIPFVLVGVTVVGVAIYVLVKRHHRRTLGDSVNFGPKHDDEEAL